MSKPIVFISFKNSDNGKRTIDADIAENLYARLDELGITTFYSNITLIENGHSEYMDAIDEALDSSIVLVLLGSEVEYIKSKWVSYEWNSFRGDMLADAKPNGMLLPYISKKISREDKPRAIKDVETFVIEDDDIERIVSFIHNYLNSKGYTFENKSTSKYDAGISSHSSYSSQAANESARLVTQGELTRSSDMPALEFALEHFEEEEDIYILDLGCAHGTIMEDRFGNSSYKNLHVIGFDRDADVIKNDQEKNPFPNFDYANIEIESPVFLERARAYMKEHNIPGFHIVTSTVFLRHMKEPQKVMKDVYELLLPGGFMFVREQDDGSIVSFGDNGLIERILDKHFSLPGVSDHFYGRKVYSQLKEAGFSKIVPFDNARTTAGKSLDYRLSMFNMSFSQRINYAKYLLSEHPEDKKIEDIVKWMDVALPKLEELFKSDSFWYQESDFVFLAQKELQ